MSAQVTMLKTIFANPADDTDRLVYADWMGDRYEREDPSRTEFIKLQIELSRAQEHTADYKRMKDRERQLLTRENMERWYLQYQVASDHPVTELPKENIRRQARRRIKLSRLDKRCVWG